MPENIHKCPVLNGFGGTCAGNVNECLAYKLSIDIAKADPELAKRIVESKPGCIFSNNLKYLYSLPQVGNGVDTLTSQIEEK